MQIMAEKYSNNTVLLSPDQQQTGSPALKGVYNKQSEDWL